jgi:hypothetical protein
VSRGVTGRRPGGSSKLLAIVIALIALAIAAAPAQAASTRAEYVAQVDQTCAAAKPALKGSAERVFRLGKKTLELGLKLLRAEPGSAKPGSARAGR